MIPIFCYHSIGNSPLCINTDIFYQQMKYLFDNGYKGCSISELLSQDLNSNSRSVGITFDDCFMTTYNNALPILIKFGFTGTFYSTLDYRDIVLWGSDTELRWSSIESSRFTIPFTFMSNPELCNLVQHGMEVGAHTISHENLDSLPDKEQSNEILESIKQLRIITSTEITSFAFPRGRYDDVSLKLLRASSALNSVTTQSGYLTKYTDLYQIPRFAASNCVEHFKSVVNLKFGRLSFYSKIKRKLSFGL